MRLRSSKFVFLLLLACTVQVGEACALRLITAQSLQNAAILDADIPGKTPSRPMDAEVSRPPRRFGLDSKATCAERMPWRMAPPALASVAVMSFTGLLRA